MRDGGPADGGRPGDPAAADGSVVRWEWTERDGTSVAVATALAVATGRDVTEMAPLARSVDADALDGLMAGRRGDDLVRVSFRHEGVDVWVASDGEIAVRLPDEH